MEDKILRLTSRVGDFEFEAGTRLSVAKLIRDNVMGEILVPDPNRLNLIETCEDARRFVGTMSDVLSEVKFTFRPKTDWIFGVV